MGMGYKFKMAICAPMKNANVDIVTCSIKMQPNSPANFTVVCHWNSLSSHIVHTINGAGNGYTGDGWTANTRTRRDGSSLLFTSGTAGTCHYLKQTRNSTPSVTPTPTAAHEL